VTVCRRGEKPNSSQRFDQDRGGGDWLNENVPGKGSFSVKTGVFMKYAAIPYRFNLAAIA